jgi:ABC-type transport system involved in multi-copper enzyme maturation permease subunit
MSRSPTRLLVRDELIGFARSKVMLVLWIVLPCIALAGFLLLPDGATGGARRVMTATDFMSLIESSIAGAVAGLLIAVDIISERNRNVYTLLVIRPIRREAIIWSKFLAVFGCVAVACIVSIVLGMAVDAVRGKPPTAASLYDTGTAIVRMIAVIAMATAAGALFGVLVRSILVAVILVLYVGQNVAVIPMLPTVLGVLPNQFWWFMVLSFALVAIALWFAGRAFRRAQL